MWRQCRLDAATQSAAQCPHGWGNEIQALGVTAGPEDSHLLGKCVTGKVEVSCPAYGFRCGIKGSGRVRRATRVETNSYQATKKSAATVVRTGCGGLRYERGCEYTLSA